jgi:carboxylate-amine ligase
MSITTPSFTMGIEEEYLLVDRDSLALAKAPDGLIEDCAEALEGRVSPEFLACQVEIGTGICRTIAEAREDLRRLRSTVAAKAAQHNLAPIAVSCHPFSDWKDQHHTDKARYNDLERALGGVARRMLICGMHVHIGIEDNSLRVDLMNQFRYFLPHLLALSVSSPFWQGVDTRLGSYRLTVFDNLPRTGLPPRFNSWGEYERTTGTLIELGVIEDTTKIWWDLRPSDKFPTLETRICDVSPRMEHALSLAALVQAITRMLWRLRAQNLSWRGYDRFLVEENRWRALRYGCSEGLIDFGSAEIRPMERLMDELLEMVAEDSVALGSAAELEALRAGLSEGSASDRQRGVLQASLDAGKSRADALCDVTRHLVDEFHADL